MPNQYMQLRTSTPTDYRTWPSDSPFHPPWSVHFLAPFGSIRSPTLICWSQQLALYSLASTIPSTACIVQIWTQPPIPNRFQCAALQWAQIAYMPSSPLDMSRLIEFPLVILRWYCLLQLRAIPERRALSLFYSLPRCNENPFPFEQGTPSHKFGLSLGRFGLQAFMPLMVTQPVWNRNSPPAWLNLPG